MKSVARKQTKSTTEASPESGAFPIAASPRNARPRPRLTLSQSYVGDELDMIQHQLRTLEMAIQSLDISDFERISLTMTIAGITNALDSVIEAAK